MKRMIGSIAAVVLALSLGVSAYAKATPKANSGLKTTASAPKASRIKNKNRKRMRNRRTRHHKTRRATQNTAKGKSQGQAKVKKPNSPQQ